MAAVRAINSPSMQSSTTATGMSTTVPLRGHGRGGSRPGRPGPTGPGRVMVEGEEVQILHSFPQDYAGWAARHDRNDMRLFAAWLCERCRLLENQNFELRRESRMVAARANAVETASKAALAARTETGGTRASPSPRAAGGGRVAVRGHDDLASRRREVELKTQLEHVQKELAEAKQECAAAKARCRTLEAQLVATRSSSSTGAGSPGAGFRVPEADMQRAREEATREASTAWQAKLTDLRSELAEVRSTLQTDRGRWETELGRAGQSMGRSSAAIRTLEAALLASKAEYTQTVQQLADESRVRQALEGRLEWLGTELAGASDGARVQAVEATRAKEELAQATQDMDRMQVRLQELEAMAADAGLGPSGVSVTAAPGRQPVKAPEPAQPAGPYSRSRSTTTREGHSTTRRGSGASMERAGTFGSTVRSPLKTGPSGGVKGTTPSAAGVALRGTGGDMMGVLHVQQDILQAPDMPQSPVGGR